MVQRLHPNSARRSSKGFNLIEAAIVLGVVGLVIGGIWVAAAGVRENMKVTETVNGIFSTVKNIQNAISISDSVAIGNAVNINDTVLAIGAIPSNWFINWTFTTPFNGGFNFMNYTNNARFDFDLYDVPKSACIKIAVRVTTMAASVNSQGIGTYKDTLGWLNINGVGTGVFPVTLAWAESQCSLDTNNMSMTFGYSRTN